MRYFLSLIITYALVFTGCSSEEDQNAPSKPEDLLEEDKMIQVMMDLQMAESYIRNNRHNIDSIQPKAFYNWVWEQHGTNKETVKRSIQYYVHYPEKMEEMYLEVINRLTQQQAKLEAEMEKNNDG